jgi:hypothetical protein
MNMTHDDITQEILTAWSRGELPDDQMQQVDRLVAEKPELIQRHPAFEDLADAIRTNRSALLAGGSAASLRDGIESLSREVGRGEGHLGDTSRPIGWTGRILAGLSVAVIVTLLVMVVADIHLFDAEVHQVDTTTREIDHSTTSEAVDGAGDAVLGHDGSSDRADAPFGEASGATVTHEGGRAFDNTDARSNIFDGSGSASDTADRTDVTSQATDADGEYPPSGPPDTKQDRIDGEVRFNQPTDEGPH